MNNETKESKFVLFAEMDMDLNFIDENVKVLSMISGTDNADEIKNKHIQTIVGEIESVLKKYDHISPRFNLMLKSEVEAQRAAQQAQNESVTEVVEGEVV